MGAREVASRTNPLTRALRTLLGAAAIDPRVPRYTRTAVQCEQRTEEGGRKLAKGNDRSIGSSTHTNVTPAELSLRVPQKNENA